LKVRCSKCGAEHDLSGIEPAFERPDAFFDVPASERDRRVSHDDDTCLIASIDGEELTCFLRVVLPVPIKGEARLIAWGLWVEVDAPTYQRIVELWNDENQDAETPFACALANEIPNYPSTLGLPATMSLRKPGVRPTVILAPDSDHAFAHETRTGVHFERALEWRLWSVHP
jgi:hypothetical protein